MILTSDRVRELDQLGEDLHLHEVLERRLDRARSRGDVSRVAVARLDLEALAVRIAERHRALAELR